MPQNDPHPTTPLQTTTASDHAARIADICDVVRRGQRFLLTSHARPDGDSIGSQVAMALAFDHLGKSSRIVNRDPPPLAYRDMPGVDRVEVAPAVEGPFDALFVMECGDLARPGVAGLEQYRVVNIDHHLGNTLYGTVNWFDTGAAACVEMVVDLLDALAVPMTTAIATAIYLGLVTDTGLFRHRGTSVRSFDIAKRCVAAGVEPSDLARQIFDGNSLGKLRLMGALLDAMTLHADGRLAVLRLDDALMAATTATIDDLDGLVNLPLSVRDIQVVLLFKAHDGALRASIRSKGDIDVRAVAARFGGGGHRNAAGLDVPGTDEPARVAVIDAVVDAIRSAT
jgi:phosphoesterase RecJ-like protein